MSSSKDAIQNAAAWGELIWKVGAKVLEAILDEDHQDDEQLRRWLGGPLLTRVRLLREREIARRELDQ